MGMFALRELSVIEDIFFRAVFSNFRDLGNMQLFYLRVICEPKKFAGINFFALFKIFAP